MVAKLTPFVKQPIKKGDCGFTNNRLRDVFPSLRNPLD